MVYNLWSWFSWKYCSLYIYECHVPYKHTYNNLCTCILAMYTFIFNKNFIVWISLVNKMYTILFDKNQDFVSYIQRVYMYVRIKLDIETNGIRFKLKYLLVRGWAGKWYAIIGNIYVCYKNYFERTENLLLFKQNINI